MGAIAMLAATLVAATQPPGASIEGRVFDDASGQPIAGAVVVLPDADGGVLTDALGRYRLHPVPSGPRHVLVRAVGYEDRTLHALVPSTGTLVLHATLRPDPIPLTGLAVRPPVASRGMTLDPGEEPPYPDRGLSLAAVRNHPLLAEPDVFHALSGGEVWTRPEVSDGIHVRGGAADHTAYVLDGFPVLSPYHVTGTFSAWNPDALARIDLLGAAPSPALPQALAGIVAGRTRAPGSTQEMQGALSTGQARATLSGPVGGLGPGYLVSFRTAFPGFIRPSREPSYLRAELGDVLAKVEARAAGGEVRLLLWDTENEVDAAAASEGEAAPPTGAVRNAFQWHSRSVGAAWRRQVGPHVLEVRAWTSGMDASSRWRTDDGGRSGLRSERHDRGALVTLGRPSPAGETAWGLRVEESRTAYVVEPDAPGPSAAAGLRHDGRTPVVTAFGAAERRLGASTLVEAAASLTAAGGAVHPAPRVRLRWDPSPTWALSAVRARLHQFIQSVRNPESVVGTIFPAELWTGAGADGIPVASSDLSVLAVEHRPFPGVRLGAQAYARTMEGLVLVAPTTGQPFPDAATVTGSGTARGVSLEADVTGARFAALGSYGWQRVRLRGGSVSYVPGWGAGHRLEAGVTVFPTVTSSVRLGATAWLGRRGTPSVGSLAWESCNLLDQGCEFGGAPVSRPEDLGRLRLPAYLRVDLAARKHWHVRVAGRDALVGIHGAITNVFGRDNVLTRILDPLTHTTSDVAMRPLAPLVVGLDWRF